MKRNLLIGLLLLFFIAPMVVADPVITPTTDPSVLVNSILGSGVTVVGAPTLTGVTNQQGTFTNGNPGVGFSSGIVLSSGNVTQIPGSNAGQSAETLGVGSSGNDNLSTSLGTGGDAQLNALAGFPTYDANILTFDFQFGDGTVSDNSLYFNYAFASEEYIDYVGSQYNDVFGFFLDGVNIALLGGQPITINNINPTANSGYYINNIANTNGYGVAGLPILFDGITTVFTASATGLGAGTHTISLKVADTSDHILDAGVFIQAGTFSTTPTSVPEPTSLLLLGTGLSALALAARRRKK